MGRHYPVVTMIKLTAAPKKTHALVVWIEKYEDSRLNVKSGSSANDALKFAE